VGEGGGDEGRDDNHKQLRQHLDDFVSAYNFGRRLKGLTPYEFIRRRLAG